MKRFDRRVALKGLAAIGVGAQPGSRVRARAAEPIVETQHGRLRGSFQDGVLIFKGIPYAASTQGGNRFLPPQPLQPWAGVRDALKFGDSAPQPTPPGGQQVLWYYQHETLSENCLSLNVFAPAAKAARGRPVMVWFHGGAWGFGCGSAPGFEASQLAKTGDVVVVTVNHRLNVFGYIALDDRDERFADAGNAGVLDLVAALRWVRDNIHAFGGDRGNVTIFGQSGGALKVSALMAAPAANGLFHKVIAQSSPGVRITPQEAAARAAHELAQRLGLPAATGEALQSVPMERLVAAARGGFRPVLDGRTLARHPFDPDAPPQSRAIPFMAGNTATETTHGFAQDRRNFSLPEEEARQRIERTLRIDASEAARIMAAYRAACPACSPSELMISITTDHQYIRNTLQMARLQAVAGRAPVYAYLFTWHTPVMDGLLRSPHTGELPFIFGTTAAAVARVGVSPDHPALTRMMMATWASFARTGDPNNPTLPSWPRYDAKGRLTMKLDVESAVERDPGGKARAALDGLPFSD